MEIISEVSPAIAPKVQARMADFIDHVNERFGASWYFWQTATCEQAVWSLIETGIEFLPIRPVLKGQGDALKPGSNQMLAYTLFQVPTMSWAYSASTQRAQRKFMGIRKGIFG